MKMYEQFLLEFFSIIENPELKNRRLKQKFVWLYHSILEKNTNNIKLKGLSPEYHGSTHGAPVEHPSGKNTLSYSSSKAYSTIWGSATEQTTLIVKVPTDELFFAQRSKMAGRFIDEYLSPKKIFPKDIVFSDSPLFKQIEDTNSYLDSSYKVW